MERKRVPNRLVPAAPNRPPGKRGITGNLLGIPGLLWVGDLKLHRAFPTEGDITRHRVWEVFLRRRGREVVRIGNEYHTVHPGQVYVVPPGSLHGVSGRHMSPGHLQFFALLEPSSESVSHLGMESRLARELFAMLNTLPWIVAQASPRLLDLFDSLTRSSLASSLPPSVVTHGHLIATLLELTRLPPPVKGESEWLSAVKSRMSRDLSHGSLPDLAKSFSMKPVMFRRRFLKESGFSAADYRLRLRVERAKEDLSTSQRSVTDIALDLGFHTSAYFTKVFHDLTGETPKSFRERNRHDTPRKNTPA